MTRSEAVNWIINISADIGKAEHSELWHYEQALSEIREMLESEPERKNGKWFLDQNGQFRCSNCERVPVNRIIIDAALVYDVPAIKKYMKYCPMCGAKMYGKESNGSVTDSDIGN